MKSLLILRHAQAAAGVPDLPDVRRPLTATGQLQARALDKWLQGRRFAPGLIACSAAVRAQETAAAVVAAAEWTTPVTAFDHFYNASGDELLAHAKSQPDEITQLMLVAHAPGVVDLVRLLTTKHVDVMLRYEAATLAEVVVDVLHWSEIEVGAGALCLLLPP